MKKKVVIVTLLSLLFIAMFVTFFIRQNRTDPVTETNLTYNPNYALAIQQNNPKLCEQISYAIISGPTDGLFKSYGKRAVAQCKEQVRLGNLGCRCDSNAILNKMTNQ